MEKEKVLIALINWYQAKEEIKSFDCIVFCEREDSEEVEIVELDSFIGLDKDNMDYSKIIQTEKVKEGLKTQLKKLNNTQ